MPTYLFQMSCLDVKENMKKNAIFTLLLLLSFFGLCGVGETQPLRDATLGTANGNKHDFSNTNTTAPIHATNEDRVCIFCHTPHGASTQSTLWNRPDPQALEAFTIYSSGTLVIDDPGVLSSSKYNDGSLYPNGSSRLCMSCHDGVVGIGQILSGHIKGDDLLTTPVVTSVITLSLSHPISFVYDNTVITAINAQKGLPNYIPPSLTEVPLDGNSRMQCTTCHDPHDDSSEYPSDPPFWRRHTATSYADVCDACHQGGEPGGNGSSH